MPRRRDRDAERFRVLDLVPSAGHPSKPQELIQIRGQEGLTLTDRRAITILWHNAHRQGIEPGKEYTIEIKDILMSRHKGLDPVVSCIETLMKTILVVRHEDGSTTRVQILGRNNLTDMNRPPGLLTYTFDSMLIELLENSYLWGRLSLHVLGAFNTSYGVTLYELVSQWIGLEHKRSHIFEVSDFRELLGVTRKAYVRFADLHAHVLKPAEKEVNDFAPFNVSISPIRRGRRTTHLHVAWWKKTIEEKREAYRRIEGPLE